MKRGVVITGIGFVTPLGGPAPEVLNRIEAGETAASKPPFDVTPFACPLCAMMPDFDAEPYFPDNKTLRFMGRPAQMAVVAARLAMQDASLKADDTYPGEEIALFGATGLAGPPVNEVVKLLTYCAAPDGSLDLGRFGKVALKRVRPVLSFKTTGNMPICFVSIFENIRGENAVYTPWEGQCSQAIAAGIRAVECGRAAAALVGGCDVKVHEFIFFSLQQLAAFESWVSHGQGSVPGEGAAFLVLEDEEKALAREARIYGRIRARELRTVDATLPRERTFAEVLSALEIDDFQAVVAAGDGDVSIRNAEEEALAEVGIRPEAILRPKCHVGNLYAAAAALQVGIAALLASRAVSDTHILANCFDHHSQQAAFVLDAV